MKKRKPPFALVSVLIVLVGAAVVLSQKVMVSSGMREAEPELQQPAQEPVKPAEAPSTKDLALEAVKPVTKKSPAMMVDAGDVPTAATRDTVMRPEYRSPKPQPTESNTRTLWWDDKKKGG